MPMRPGLRNLVQFFREDVWRIRARELTRFKSFLIKVLRVLLLSFRGISEDRCTLRASALTYYSMLLLVPVLAMLFGVAKGFGFESALERQLMANLEGQQEVLRWIISFARRLLEDTRGGVIAGTGLVVLFWSAIKVLSHIENAFDDVWGVQESRSLFRKITDYLSVILIAPVLFILSSTATVLIAARIKVIVEKISLLGAISPIIFFVLKLLPYGTLWLLFGFVYLFVPNTKVRFIPAAVAGITAGSLYHLFQWVYIAFQIGVAKYNAIYGSFAALPLFLVWLYASWLIVLFGAELSFACQNVDAYELEPDFAEVSHRFRRLLTLWIVHRLVRRFLEGGEPWNEEEIAETLQIPVRLVRRIVRDLLAAGIVSRVALDGDRRFGYQPARPPELLTLHYVIKALDERGRNHLPVAAAEDLERLAEALGAFDELIRRAPENRRLGDI